MADDRSARRPVAVLFDIDATLITTGGAGAKAWRRSFHDLYGVGVDIMAYTVTGQTDPEVAHDSFVGALRRDPEPDELARVIAGYLDALPETVEASDGYRIMPGVEALLTRMRDDGVLLGLTTGNLEAAAHIKLSRADLNRFFAFGGYGSDSGDRVELTRTGIERAAEIRGEPVTPADCDVVGDTPRDVAAAHGAGAVAVGVATGDYSLDDLRNAGAEHVLTTLEDPYPGL
jgi:beta-phosphoglucomutase-like phosphatase (HAD superfamily)